MRARLGVLALFFFPTVACAQQADHAARVDSLLDVPEVGALLGSLEDSFLGHFLLLVPDLADAERNALMDAAADAFRASVLRELVSAAIATEASDEDLTVWLASRRSGARTELRRTVADHEPAQSFREFSADLSQVDPARLQLMASLVEARGESELELAVDEALRQLAHELVVALGGEIEAFQPTVGDALDAAYRDRTIRLALEALHRMEPAPDELVRSAVEEYRTEAARRFADRFREAVLTAVTLAGQRIASLTVADAPAELVPVDPAELPPCRVEECGFLVEWTGPEPAGNVRGYGTPGDFERLTFQHLVTAGYLLVRGTVDDGLTIHLRPRSMAARCEIISGTNNRSCLALGQVRVEFVGSYPGHETPNNVLIRNRCRANEFMAAPGISSLVAARIHYELTTFPGDERRVPSC